MATSPPPSRRVMMLVHDFPPASGGGTRRPQKLASHLPTFGWQPAVITLREDAYSRRDDAAVAALPPGIEIHRTATLASPRRTEEGRARAGNRSGPSGPLRGRVQNFVREHLLVPDSRVLWWPFAAAAAISVHRRHPVDVLWATGPPFSATLLGVRLGHRMGVPVVTDLRDPWGLALEDQRAEESPRRKARERAQEAEVLRRSAAVVVTAPGLREAILCEHPSLDPERVVTIPNGYDPEEYEGVTPQRDHRFGIVYTGKLVEPLYDPRVFFDALDRWLAHDPSIADRVRVDLLGEVSPRWAEDLRRRPSSRMVELHGHVDHATVRARQLGADLLLVLLGPSAGRLRVAGKVFEYLYAGPPILAMVPADSGTAEILRETGSGQVVDVDDREGATGALRQAFEGWARTPASVADRRVSEEVRKYARRSLTCRLGELLTDVIRERRGGG